MGEHKEMQAATPKLSLERQETNKQQNVSIMQKSFTGSAT
jgi:hypothetical protein